MTTTREDKTLPAMMNTAFLLSLIAPLFSYLKDGEYGQMLQNEAWQDVCAGGAATGAADAATDDHNPLTGDALSLPPWPVRSSLQNDVLVSGMPFAAMPVESLYKAWSGQSGNAFGASRGLYLGDAARHLSAVYEKLAIDVPAAFASMPDHLTLQLELLALMLEAGNDDAARDLVSDHFDWLGAYNAALSERRDLVRASALPDQRRQDLLRGIGFLQALVAFTDRIVHEAVAGKGEARGRARPLGAQQQDE